MVDKAGVLQVDLPKKLLFLFDKHRYKVAYGGRGSGKSHSFARALITLGVNRPLRILCTREVQKSIKESVKLLLEDTISNLGLTSHYQVLETEIRGINGTFITFAGLAQHTVDSIKSYEGFDIVWVEEAHSVSEKSWQVLIPTIRAEGSEIWVSFNPELDTDPVWKRFVANPPPSAKVVKVNYTDNPWFPKVLEEERIHCQVTQPDDYRTIWEGECRAAVQGAIYASEISRLLSDNRVSRVPYDPRLKVHAIWDLGFNDATSITMVQKAGFNAIAVIDFLEDNQKTIDWYAAELNRKGYNWGPDWLPHDATHRDLKTGTTVQALLHRMRGKKPKIIPNIGVEAGIRMARMLFQRTYWDRDKTQVLIDHLKRYRRHVNAQTGEPGSPVHDEHSHAADSWRYVGVVADQLSNEVEDQEPVVGGTFEAFDSEAGY